MISTGYHNYNCKKICLNACILTAVYKEFKTQTLCIGRLNYSTERSFNIPYILKISNTFELQCNKIKMQ